MSVGRKQERQPGNLWKIIDRFWLITDRRDARSSLSCLSESFSFTILL